VLYQPLASSLPSSSRSGSVARNPLKLRQWAGEGLELSRPFAGVSARELFGIEIVPRQHELNRITYSPLEVALSVRGQINRWPIGGLTGWGVGFPAFPGAEQNRTEEAGSRKH
jgi:hypothetical protein